MVATIAVAAVSRLRYDALARLVARSPQVQKIDQMLENRYKADSQTSLPASATVPVGAWLTTIRQPDERGEDAARDTWDGGKLRQRDLLQATRIPRLETFVRFRLSPKRMSGVGWAHTLMDTKRFLLRDD